MSYVLAAATAGQHMFSPMAYVLHVGNIAYSGGEKFHAFVTDALNQVGIGPVGNSSQEHS